MNEKEKVEITKAARNNYDLIKKLKKDPQKLKKYVDLVNDGFLKNNDMDLYLDCIEAAVIAYLPQLR